MSYLGGPFEHDVFVSYSHGDYEGTGESQLKQWSQEFALELEKELKAQPKFRDLSIFLDQHHRPDQGVDPMQAPTAQLREDIEATGLLTVLMTPHYLLSKWCADEREWWFDCQNKAGLPVEGRVAVARVWPTENPWPEEFTDERGEPLVGMKFYDARTADYHPWPYEWPSPAGTKGPFRDALLGMVGRIWQKLDILKKHLEEREERQQEAARLAAESGQVIYLHARAEHTEEWESTWTALNGHGYAVLPSEPDPVAKDTQRMQEIRKQRVQMLSGCDGLLLVGTDDGRALDHDLISVGRQDRQLARGISNRSLPCAVVNTDTSSPTIPRRKSIARSFGIDWIDTTESEWTTDVGQLLVEASEAVSRA